MGNYKAEIEIQEQAEKARESSGYSDWDDGHACATNEGSAFYEGYIAGASKGGPIHTLKQVIDYLEDYRRAYSEDLCPARNLEEFDPMLRTVVAFHMGRFLIDNMLKDARAALKKAEQ